MTNKSIINKFQVDFMIKDLVNQINDNNEKFTHIVGIANGGLNISIPISKILNLPHKSITIRFYGDSKTPNTTPKEINFDQLNDLNENSNLLFCDDLIDTGVSFDYLKRNIKFKHKIAVLYHNKNNKYNLMADYFCYEKPNEWVNFWWDHSTDV